MKAIISALIALVVLVAAGLLYWFVFKKDLSDQIVVPYIAHQKPRVDPHVPSAVPIADKLDEVLFDGLFNVSANASGITYENGLGEYVGLTPTNVLSIRLNPTKKWHDSYAVTMDKKKIAITENQAVNFVAQDLEFTLRRIQKLGSLSPDYILVSQAIADFAFTGPDANGEIQFQLRGDRVWTESDIKEILSFKILPAKSSMNAPEYTDGTGPYLLAGEFEDEIFYRKSPDGNAIINNFVLKPFIDNSTYTTELKNRNINTVLSTTFGSVSPILADSTKFFHKSSIATTFFAVLFNMDRLNADQRLALRKLINNEMLIKRFFKIGTPQQRHIANYKGDKDNYEEYLNFSIFPTTSYYVEEKVVVPQVEHLEGNLDGLPDTVRIATCLNYDYREELTELIGIMNDPTIYHGKIKVSAVDNDQIASGNYDAVLVPFSGYRSNFMFDLYAIMLREPDFGTYRVNLRTIADPATGKATLDPSSVTAGKNFFRLDLSKESPEQAEIKKLYDYMYGFMASSEIGDKQAYAGFIDQIDQRIAFGAWLFSLPSLAYFSTQFEEKSIDMYGTASQLSTIEKWKEMPKKQ